MYLPALPPLIYYVTYFQYSYTLPLTAQTFVLIKFLVNQAFSVGEKFLTSVEISYFFPLGLWKKQCFPKVDKTVQKTDKLFTSIPVKQGNNGSNLTPQHLFKHFMYKRGFLWCSSTVRCQRSVSSEMLT